MPNPKPTSTLTALALLSLLLLGGCATKAKPAPHYVDHCIKVTGTDHHGRTYSGWICMDPRDRR